VIFNQQLDATMVTTNVMTKGVSLYVRKYSFSNIAVNERNPLCEIIFIALYTSADSRFLLG